MHLKLIAKLKKKTEKPVFILMPNFNTFTFLKVQHVLSKGLMAIFNKAFVKKTSVSNKKTKKNILLILGR